MLFFCTCSIYMVLFTNYCLIFFILLSSLVVLRVCSRYVFFDVEIRDYWCFSANYLISSSLRSLLCASCVRSSTTSELNFSHSDLATDLVDSSSKDLSYKLSFNFLTWSSIIYLLSYVDFFIFLICIVSYLSCASAISLSSPFLTSSTL